MIRRSLAFAPLFACALAASAAAQSRDPLGRYKDWDAYKLTAEGQVTCYIVSKPKEMTPKNVKRDPVYFLISHYPARSVISEPSIQAGYAYRDGSSAVVTVESTKFEFFTKEDGAWLTNSEDEKKLLAAMRKGSSLVVKGTSSRGTITTDRYSLAGISAALDKIDAACK